MKTLIAMVTIGPDTTMRMLAVKRATAYASKHGYNFERIHEPSRPESDRTPHWEKLLVPDAFPGYDRYLVIDDDILINHRVAPKLPDIPDRNMGLVKEPIPGPFVEPVDWVGNTGFMLVRREALDLMEKSYEFGEYEDIAPGFGDQPAVNAVAWRENRVTRVAWNWNYLLMADWLMRSYRLQSPWTKNTMLARIAKVTLTFRLLTSFLPHSRTSVISNVKNAYMLHLTWYRMGAPLIDRVLGD